MSFYKNIGVDRPISREFAKIMGAIQRCSSLQSDLDFFMEAVSNIETSNNNFALRGNLRMFYPFYVETHVGIFKIALFNELHFPVLGTAAEALEKQYHGEIMLFGKESKSELGVTKQLDAESKKVVGYSAVILCEHDPKKTETIMHYPENSVFDYFLPANKNNCSFHVVGQTVE